MSHDFPKGVDEVCVAPVSLADRAAKVVSVRWLEDQMDVVGHQAVGPHADIGLLRLLGQQVEVDFVVTVFKEDGLAPIAKLRDRMRQPRNNDTSQSSPNAP